MVLLSFDERCHLDPITIPPIPEDVYEYLRSLPKEISRILLPTLQHAPRSAAYAFRTTKGAYSIWRHLEAGTVKSVANCNRNFGFLKNPEHPKTAWAFIAAKLLSIVHCVTEEEPFFDLSAQYLLDRVPVHESMISKKDSVCCNMNTVEAGITYALEGGIPKEQDWKFTGCNNEAVIEEADITYFKVRGKVASLPLKEALVSLNTKPIAAKLHLFDGFDKLNPNAIYCGPSSETDEYKGSEDVLVYETKIINDVWVAVVNIPAKQLSLNVSLEYVIVYVPRDDVIVHDFDYDVDGIARKRLAAPGRLLTEFVAVLDP